MRVTAVRKGYFGGKIRDAGEGFSIPDALMKDDKLRPSWVEAGGGARDSLAEAEGESLAASPEPGDGEPAARKRSRKPKPMNAPEGETGNGLIEALGGPPPDWLPGGIE